MPDTPASRTSFSISKLRTLILLCLAVGVAVYTLVMFSLADNLAQRFRPQVRVDLAWRVQRGAQELARACEVGLAISDAATVKKCFGAYETSGDVRAIVTVDEAGKLLAQHGDAPEPLETLLSGEPGQLREGDGYLVSWAPAVIEGVVIGKVAVVVSTQRLAEANALLKRSSDTTLAGGLAALVLGVIVVTFFTRAVAQRDSQLSDYAANLERKVEQRTRELDARNRGMRLVLDNVDQGFVTIDLDGKMASERSAVFERWFGSPAPDASLSALLSPHAPTFAQWLEIGLEQLREGIMPAALVLYQLPKRFATGARTYDVTYQPLGSAPTFSQLLVIVSDVTEALARSRSEAEQRELVGFFQRISVDRSGVEEFLAEAASLVAALRKERDPVLQKRLVHTLKGNCSIYGLDSFAELAHRVEDELAESGAALSDEQRNLLVSMWKQAMQRVGWLLGSSQRDTLEIDKSTVHKLASKVRAGMYGTEVLLALTDWLHEPVATRLDRLGRQASVLARRLGKADPRLKIDDHGVRLSPDGWAMFWSSMVHVVRNAVDHGVEDPEARALAGKPEAGMITLSAERKQGQLIISVSDDGRGIAWEKVRTRAAAVGLPSKEPSDLVAALFCDGVSTREHVGAVSGRGVGLSALKEAVTLLGGEIEVASVDGRGATFRCVFDEKTAVRAAERVPKQTLTSLMPTARAD